MKQTVILAAVAMIMGCVQPQPTESSSAGNQNPIIRSLVANPQIISVGTSCTLSVDAVDPDSDPLTYEWNASAGDIIGQGASVRYTASFCCTGSNRISVTVKDNRGGSATANIDVEVR